MITSVEDATFTPGLILMGNNVPSQGTIPSFVQTPVLATCLIRRSTRLGAVFLWLSIADLPVRSRAAISAR